jgi:F-type H+-transporting ATPase subunit epsilon
MPENHRTVKCVVVTPERALVDERVDFVALPMYDGELGVLPGRAPMIGRLGPGELRIRHGEHIQRFFVDGGFAQVRADVVTVLTPRAQKAETIDAAAAAAALEAAHAVATTPQAQAAQQKAQDRARAQLRLAAKETDGGARGGH